MTTSTTTTSTTTITGETVLVYFNVGDGGDCGEVAAFPREVPVDGATVEAALAELVAGPTAEEIAAGAGSFFSSDTADVVRTVTEGETGVLIVDFTDLRFLIPNASTSCGSEALLAQLNYTVLQFVPRVRYEIDGSCDIFSNWLQRECVEFTADGQVLVDIPTNERASGAGCIAGDELGDGRWFGYVDSTSATDIGFDLACWFVGTAAVDAAAEDGEESPPPNDYYVRNDSDVIRTISVAADAPVMWLPDAGDPSTLTEVVYGEWLTEREARLYQPGVWLTMVDGMVVAIEEQFVP